MQNYFIEILWECFVFLFIGFLLYQSKKSFKLEKKQKSEENLTPSKMASPDSRRLTDSLKYYICNYFSIIYFILMIIIGMLGNITPNTSNFISILYVFIGLFFLVYNELNQNPRKFQLLCKYSLF